MRDLKVKKRLRVVNGVGRVYIPEALSYAEVLENSSVPCRSACRDVEHPQNY
jgi:hypothetical protein